MEKFTAIETRMLAVQVSQRFYNSHALTNLAVSWRGGGSSRSDFKIAVGCPTVFREGPGTQPPLSHHY